MFGLVSIFFRFRAWRFRGAYVGSDFGMLPQQQGNASEIRGVHLQDCCVQAAVSLDSLRFRV